MENPLLPASMLFRDGNGPNSGYVTATESDRNEVGLHLIRSQEPADPDSAYLSPVAAAALGQQLIAAATRSLTEGEPE